MVRGVVVGERGGCREIEGSGGLNEQEAALLAT